MRFKQRETYGARLRPIASNRLQLTELTPLIASYRVMITLICMMNLTSCGFITGERYTKEGHMLSTAMNNELITQGLCKSPKECNQILKTYVAHGNQVNYTMYAPQNKLMLAAVFKFLVEKGTDITNGVAISVKVYPRPREEYGIFDKREPYITLEIK